MIRLSLLAIVFATFSPLGLQAAPVPIQAGEHADFTRVVLEVPENADWQVNNTPGKVTIQLSNYTDGFDTAGLFSVIPRTRLAEAAVEPDAITLQLNCACPVDYFFERGQFLVLDISDGPPLPPQAANSESATPTIRRSGFGYGDLLWSQNAELQEDDDGKNGENTETLEPAPQKADADKALRDRHIRQTQQSLLEAFSEATARGLIEADLPQAPDKPSAATQPSIEANPVEEPVRAADIDPDLMQQVQISNSSELIVSSGAPAVALICPDPELINISDWGTTTPFNHQINSVENQLFDELGKVREGALTRRVKLYLFFGFGAEALRIAQLSGEFEQQQPHLVDIANIVEFGLARNPREVHKYPHCNSGFALWALLADPDYSSPQNVNSEAALQALERLPAHLRGFLGQLLSKRFLAMNMTEEASIALRSSTRSQPDGTDPSLASALITKNNGNSEQAQQELQLVLAENSADSPMAMIELVNSAVLAGRPVTADVALAVEGFAFELRKNELGPELAQAHALAAASSGQIQKAYEVRDRAAEVITAGELRALDSTLLEIVVRQANELQFLETAFNRISFAETSLEPAAVLGAARKLMDLGFASRAGELVDSISESFQTPEKRVLQAEISLAANDGASALAHLADLNEEKATQLRAQALLLIGENEDASRSFAAANNRADASFALRIAENWNQLVPLEDPVFGSVAGVSTEALTQFESQENLLTETERALTSASQARQILTDLIAAAGSGN